MSLEGWGLYFGVRTGGNCKKNDERKIEDLSDNAKEICLSPKASDLGNFVVIQ